MNNNINNEYLIERVGYWEAISPLYSRIFNIPVLNAFIRSADIISAISNIDKQSLYDFIDGIVIIFKGLSYENSSTNKNKMLERGNSLIKPVFSIVQQYIKTDYQDYLLSEYIHKKLHSIKNYKTELIINDEDIEAVWKEHYQWLSKLKPFNMKTKLTENQIRFLHSKMEDKYFKVRYEDIRSIFGLAEYRYDFNKAKWLLKSGKDKPHKTALREFLRTLLDREPKQSEINSNIIDCKGNPINLAKPKKGEYTSYIKEFESIINEMKKL